MGRLRRTTLAMGFALVASSCGSWREPSGGGASSRALASSAVRATLDAGAHEALLNQAVATSYAVARARIEGSGRQLTTAQVGELESAIRKVVTDTYPREAWEETLLPLFLSNLDRDELRALLAFQGSPLGRKLLVIQARLMAGNQISYQLLQTRRDEFARRLSEELGRVFKDAAPQ